MSGWRLIISSLLAGAVVSVALAELYRVVSILVPIPSDAGWIASLIVNSMLACVVAGIMLTRGLPALPANAAPPKSRWTELLRRWWFVPSIAIAAGSAALALTSSATSEARHLAIPGQQWWFILLVPVVEEMVFRAGIGRWFRAMGGWMWGSYISALLFSFVHSSPDISHLMAGRIGLPLGPFLLGVCCEILYASSGRIWAAILFHMACNATPAIFASIDARWLEWLGGLYS